MLKDITIGQYYKEDSLIHRLDPRVKLFAVLIYVITLFMHKAPATYVMSLLFLIITIKISKVPVKYILRGLKAIAVILLFSVMINMLFIPGKPVIQFWIISISAEGIRTTIYLGSRLIMLVLGTSLLTFTTTPNELTDGLDKSLGFLNKVGVPVHEIAMMMSIALRFIPILTEELEKIMKAQTARGIDFESGGLLKRVKSMVPIIVPLFVAAIRRANDLAMAMESRCYHGGVGRTKLKPLKYEKRDKIAFEKAIEQSLSTFSSHMTNIVSILEHVNEQSLVLFDELCAGTDPTEGAALAISILSQLHSRGIRTMATTHYSEIKVFALSTEGVENACCEFDMETLSPTYRLLIGIPGKSNAFAISGKLGLDASIIEDAKSRITENEENFEDLIARLEDSRLTIEKEQAEISSYKAEIETLKKRLEEKQP